MKSIRVIPRLLAILGTAFLAFALPAQPAAAQIATLSQNRTVAADGSSDGATNVDSESVSAPDFDPFDATADIGVGSGASAAQARTSQQSGIGAGSLTAQGAADITVNGCCGPFGAAGASGESLYDVRFNLTGVTAVTLTGQVSGSTGPDEFGGTGTGSVLFAGPSGTLYEQSVTTPGDTPLSYTAVLQPGLYRLTARATAGGGAAGRPNIFAGAFADYSLSFDAVPEPAGLTVFGVLLLLGDRRCRRTVIGPVVTPRE
jgi:hypothetical protein